MTETTPQIRLFNTLSKTKEVFTPLDPGNVRMYVCGPTVYDYAHIGNARPAIVFDVLFRLLHHVYGADHVTYVRNITDVDDKINARALRDFPDLPLNEAIGRVTQKTADQYQSDTAALGCLAPTYEPRATQHIDGMIVMIQHLIKRGHAYVAKGSEGREVLFNTASMSDYGQLSKRKLDEQQAGARVAVEAHKKNPADFVLWKESASDQPGWKASFQDGWRKVSIYGRPGWHIECSVMSEAFLGKEFDIHGGGLDLIFPHHENELAQSRCAHGTNSMAQIWMHNGFVQVEGQKMSKSLGNFITIHELLATDKFGGRSWPGDVLRLAMLMTNYREPVDFSVVRLEEAAQILRRWKNAILARGLQFEEANRDAIAALQPCSKLVAALSDDLNMSGVVAELHRHAGGNERHNGERLFASLRLLGLATFESMQSWIEEEKAASSTGSSEASAIDAAISARIEALNAKDFARADEIRSELAEQGIQLMDSKDPDTGERVTRWEVKR